MQPKHLQQQQKQPIQYQQQYQQQYQHHPQHQQQQQNQQSPQTMSQHMPQTPTRPEIKITQMPVATSNSNDTAHHYVTNVGGGGPVNVKTITNSGMPTITTSAPTINLTSSNVVHSEQQTTTIHTSAKNQNSNKLAQEQENEQFALA